MAKIAPRYTVDAGRQILRDGIRVATVYSITQTHQVGALFPADADEFTHEVAKILNAWPDLLTALKDTIPLLIRLGDFIGNGEVTGPDSLGVRCDVILAARNAIRAAEEL